MIRVKSQGSPVCVRWQLAVWQHLANRQSSDSFVWAERSASMEDTDQCQSRSGSAARKAFTLAWDLQLQLYHSKHVIPNGKIGEIDSVLCGLKMSSKFKYEERKTQNRLLSQIHFRGFSVFGNKIGFFLFKVNFLLQSRKMWAGCEKSKLH